MDTYKIVRFFRDGQAPEVRQEGLTLAEAQAHCKRADTLRNNNGGRYV